MQPHTYGQALRALSRGLVAGVLLIVALCGGQPVRAAAQDIDDNDITWAIESDLMIDPTVTSDAVDVNTVDGIVTLSGTVDNMLAKERAVKIAETIKGVRAVIDRLNVRPTGKSDQDIRNDLVWALANDPATELYEITVNVDAGTVTLTGEVDSWQEKELAGQVAKGVAGVRGVENKITWDYVRDRLDTEIESEIERALESSVWIDDALIDISVNDGNVKLTGTVGSSAEKRRAYSKAWVAGVRSVDDSGLKVEWWARDSMRRESKYASKSAEQIEKSVKDALKYDPRVLSFDVGVDAVGGSVTLTGNVDNLMAKKAAERDAKNTVGVYRVTNLVKVRPTLTKTDATVAGDVRHAFRVDPLIERADVHIDLRNGRVYLYGRVDSQYERQHAQDVAARQVGVIDVENRLIIGDWKWKPDWEIEQDIESQLFWSLFVDSDDINVTVDDGVATLKGEVSTWSEQDAAIANAYEGGAKRVISELDIEYAPPGYTPPYYGPSYGPYYEPTYGYPYMYYP